MSRTWPPPSTLVELRAGRQADSHLERGRRTPVIGGEGRIGPEKSLQIFGRALATYMTPSTTFYEARQACLKAAADLYGQGSPEARKVADAWNAAGVR
jgi:bacillolysin